MCSTRFESNCKRFRNNAKRENVDLKTDPQIKRTRSSKRINKIHLHNEVKEKLYPNSFNFVSISFEHPVQDMYASQKVQSSSSLRRPEIHFRHAQGHQRTDALTGPIKTNQNKYYRKRSKTSKDSYHKSNTENGLVGFQK